MQLQVSGGPALLAFAADAGAFAALGGQHAGVAGVGITPAQVVLRLAGQRGVIPVAEPPMTKVRTGPNCASIGLAQDAFVGVKHSSTCPSARCRSELGLACRRVPEEVLADPLFADMEDGADLLEGAAEIS
jgi:hypothetical protein